MDLDKILSISTFKYPDGCRKFETQLSKLKRNLNIGDTYTCDICNKVITHKANFKRHVESHKNTFKCYLCNCKFNRIDNLKRHERGHLTGYKPSNNNFICQDCGFNCNNYSSLFDHCKQLNHFQWGGKGPNIHHKTTVDSALDSAVEVFSIFPTEWDKYDLLTFFYNIRPKIVDYLEERCEKLQHIKYNLNVNVIFERETMDGERDTSQPYFASKTYTLLSKNDSSEMDINEAFQKQFKSFDVYIARGSGWTLKHVIRMEIQTLQYRPIGGSNYFPLPESLQRSHSVVNIRNDDQKCFLWSILAHLHPAECNPNRIAHYTAYENELDMTGISYPVQVKHIPKFENQNDVAVNVLGFENEQLFPMYVSEHKDKKYKVDLLYITGGDKAHYCYIKHFNRLMSRTVNSGRAYKFCRYCLRGCTSQKVLEKHLKYCSQHKAQFFEFPTKGDGDIVKFEDFAKTMMVLFVIYCDFEAFSQKIDTCIPNPSTSNTTTMIDFEACGYGYKVVCCVDERYTKPTVIYRGPKASEHFLENILKEEKYIRDILDVIEPMQMTAEDEAAFQNSTHCSLCGDMFTKKTGKVRDHDHISGRYRMAACSNCNLNYKHPTFIPVFFHNLRGFDSHILMQAIGHFKRRRISVIPNNMQRYISFSLGSLRFLDSFQFLSSSLASLVDDLVNDSSQNYFKYLSKEFPSSDERNLLLRKGVYPYGWVDGESKFNETCLPPKDAFYNDLTKSHISDEDYNHAKDVWSKFHLKNMGEYHDLYMKCDV